jgi:hypothetical protein
MDAFDDLCFCKGKGKRGPILFFPSPKNHYFGNMEVISLILVAALLLGAGAISIELGISVAILEILIGVFASNALEIGDVSWMEFLSTFGLVGIMFFAGFETDHKLLKENWKQSILIGSISYFFTFLLVFLLSYFYLAQSMMSSLLLSIGLSTTSLALVYAIMTERKMLDRKLGQIILSSAMVVDVLSMVSLMVIFEGVSWRSLFTLVIFMVGLVYFPRIGMWFFKRYHHDNVEFQSRFILVVMLSLILVARAIHIHLAIIAFITGFMLSDIVKQNKQLKANLQAVIFGFMAPLFLLQSRAFHQAGSRQHGYRQGSRCDGHHRLHRKVPQYLFCFPALLPTLSGPLRRSGLQLSVELWDRHRQLWPERRLAEPGYLHRRLDRGRRHFCHLYPGHEV